LRNIADGWLALADADISEHLSCGHSALSAHRLMSFSVQANHRSKIMPTYEIEQYELHTTKYRIEANSEGEAIANLFAGQSEAVDQSQEMIEVANDYGMPADEFPELVRELATLGVSGIDDVIPSIRSIDEV
jgi:hypothetical protein